MEHNHSETELEVKLYRNGEKLKTYTKPNDYLGKFLDANKTGFAFGCRHFTYDSNYVANMRGEF